MALGSMSTFLLICALGTLLFSCIFGAILSYHWIRFSLSPVVASAGIMIYWIITTILLLILFGAALSA